MSNFEQASFTLLQNRNADAADSSIRSVELSKYTAYSSRNLLQSDSSRGRQVTSNNNAQGGCTFDGFDGEPGESSVFGASFNFINSIVGAGIIGKDFLIQCLILSL